MGGNKNKKGVTMIVVTHNQSLAARMQRTLRLKNGRTANQTEPR
jgi:predicted ABC-type transport system involved in lysophospholipase L1 biosynthesis ATPase subunit